MNARKSSVDVPQYDVVVIGGGPAGLSAALYLALKTMSMLWQLSQNLVAATDRPTLQKRSDGLWQFEAFASLKHRCLGLGASPMNRSCCTRVSSIDAAGIGELVRAYNMTVAVCGELRILHATKRVRELLERAGLFDRLTS